MLNNVSFLALFVFRPSCFLLAHQISLYLNSFSSFLRYIYAMWTKFSLLSSEQ